MSWTSYYYSVNGSGTNGVCLTDGVATARYMVCIARHVGPAEKSMPAFSLQQFTTKQDLDGKILACDTRFVKKTAQLRDIIIQSAETFLWCFM